MHAVESIMTLWMAAGLMAAALVAAALVMKSRVFPRWAMVTAAGIYGLGIVVTALVAPGREGWNVVANGSYGGVFIALLGGTPAAGPRWCHSPWALIASSVALTAGLAVAQLL
jgi:hypothetical protein